MSIIYRDEFKHSPETWDVVKAGAFKIYQPFKILSAPDTPVGPDADDTVENVDWFHTPGFQHPSFVKIDVPLVFQDSIAIQSIANFDISASKTVELSQLLLVATEVLTSITEEQFLDSLTEDDYQKLISALDKLIDVVGEDENHLYAILMHFIGKLIEKYEEKIDATSQGQPLDEGEVGDEWESRTHLSANSLEGAYSDDEPEYTTDMLISVNPDYEDASEKWVSGSPLPADSLEETSSDDETQVDRKHLR